MDNQNNADEMVAVIICKDDTVAIPRDTYNEMHSKAVLLDVIMASVDKESWVLKDVVKTVHALLFPDSYGESAGDSDA